MLPILATHKLILASSSPRRAELLRAAGFDPAIIPSRVDESVQPGESPTGYAERIARAKAQKVVAQLPGQSRVVVIGADTIVVVDDQLLGKPASSEEARRMLRLLSDREHRVLTALVLFELPSGRERVRLVETRVSFLKLTDTEIEEYLDSGEPFDKAGAYAVQGRASRFVREIRGCYANVVGLPVATLYEMLREWEATTSRSGG